MGRGWAFQWAWVRSRKFAIMPRPCSVETDSGWNWTPQTGRVRWRRPMMTPSSDQAVASRESGRGSATLSEW
ncbi:hypothetical protein GCM10020254_01780 [Streptomyces goshikiensis]